MLGCFGRKRTSGWMAVQRDHWRVVDWQVDSGLFFRLNEQSYGKFAFTVFVDEGLRIPKTQTGQGNNSETNFIYGHAVERINAF